MLHCNNYRPEMIHTKGPRLAVLGRIAPLITLAAVVVASARIVSTYEVFSHTFDEPGHLACGVHYLQGFVCPYEYAPLARAAIAVGPYLAGARSQQMADIPREGLAILAGHYTRFLALARCGALPFFWMACGALYWWGRRYFGKATAAMSVLLFSLLPPVLAHAGLATADIALTGCLTAAFLAWLMWTERPTWRRSVVCGVLTGLAVLAKFSTCGFLPAILAIASAWYILVERPAARHLWAALRARLAPFCVAGFAAFVAWWAGYQFSLGRVDGIPIPAPEFVTALRYIANFNAHGQAAYLFGEVSDTGWWYYYPAALALKTPVAFLLLLGCGLLSFRSRWRRTGGASPLIFAAGILLVGSFSKTNIGVRHVLPVYCGLALLAGNGTILLLSSKNRPTWGILISAALLGWLIWTGAAKHPDYLAYFNELAAREPEKVLVDSDLDWGQDFNRLARRLHVLGAREVHFSTRVPADLESVQGFPPVRPIDPVTPAPGWTAVSPTWWKLRQFEFEAKPLYRGGPCWMDRNRPTERVGSILLFHFSN
jgi:hypothetical protein